MMVSEAVLVLSGWPDDTDSRWTIQRAEHALSKQRGYVSNITAEPVSGA